MKKRAFTLVEMLVAMSITIIVLSFGSVGVIRFRDYIELQNGYSDIYTYIRTTQNKARNSIAYTTSSGIPVAPDYYGIYIENNNFSLYACNETSPTQVNCSQQEADAKSLTFSSVEITLSAGCPGNMIAFENSSVEIVAITGTQILGQINAGNIVSAGNCDLDLTHTNGGSTKSLSINLTQNSINE